MFDIERNYDFELRQRDREWEKYLDTLPVCAECGEPIVGMMFDTGGDRVCEECVKNVVLYIPKKYRYIYEALAENAEYEEAKGEAYEPEYEPEDRI